MQNFLNHSDAAPIYQELENLGDLDPQYTARANKTAGGKLSKQDADAILKQEFARKGKHGLREFEKVFEKVMRQSPQASEADLGLSQTGNAPSSTLQVGNNISSLGELVNSNEVLADTIKRVKRANSSLKNLADTDFKVINEARRALSQASLNKMDISGYEARQALKELDPALDKIIPQYAEARKIYEGALFANLAYALGSSPRLTGEAAYQLGSLADRLSKIKVGNINAGSLASREKNK